ncbi:TPA: hypothetical protein MIP58_27570, partial [Klebsiella pneumoniae]|nr:hypothetical protein [Klebsiella pneumoniae]
RVLSFLIGLLFKEGISITCGIIVEQLLFFLNWFIVLKAESLTQTIFMKLEFNIFFHSFLKKIVIMP